MSWISWSKITNSKQDGGLGIRNLEDFNLALLAKQGWRILTNPYSLLARVYKAKYFRYTNFLDAKCFTTSSYAWKSIVKSQNLLKSGLKWIVGNGESINIWKDPWISSKPARPATGPGGETHPHLKVKDLINNISKIWDEQLINRLLSQEDVQYVRNIRPSITNGEDKLIWSYTSTGAYNVKSGYHLQRQITSQNDQLQGGNNFIPEDN